MSEIQQDQPEKTGPRLIPANFSDDDARMSKFILVGFAIIVGSLLMLMGVPRILERLS